jgi:hypothetical protein
LAVQTNPSPRSLVGNILSIVIESAVAVVVPATAVGESNAEDGAAVVATAVVVDTEGVAAPVDDPTAAVELSTILPGVVSETNGDAVDVTAAVACNSADIPADADAIVGPDVVISVDNAVVKAVDVDVVANAVVIVFVFAPLSAWLSSGINV